MGVGRGRALPACTPRRCLHPPYPALFSEPRHSCLSQPGRTIMRRVRVLRGSSNLALPCSASALSVGRNVTESVRDGEPKVPDLVHLLLSRRRNACTIKLSLAALSHKSFMVMFHAPDYLQADGGSPSPCQCMSTPKHEPVHFRRASRIYEGLHDCYCSTSDRVSISRTLHRLSMSVTYPRSWTPHFAFAMTE